MRPFQNAGNSLPPVSDRRFTIGLLTSNLRFDYSVNILKGVSDTAREYEMNLFCVRGGEIRSRNGIEAQGNVLYNLINPNNFDGILLASNLIGQFIDVDEMHVFCDQFSSLPLVSIGEKLAGIPSVLMDNYIGMYNMVHHLIHTHGFRQIAFIGGPEGHPEANERFRAYVDALRDHGIPFDSQRVCYGDFLFDSGRQSITLLVEQRKIAFDAIIIANDNMAFGALKELKERGFQVPGDIAVTGFDNEDRCKAILPTLTTIHQPVYEMGRKAAELLLAAIKGDTVSESVSLPARIVVRQSCGCATSRLIIPDDGGQIPGAETEDRTISEIPKEPILTRVVQILETHNIPYEPTWVEHVLDELLTEIFREQRGRFLQAFQELLQQNNYTDDELMICQNLLSLVHSMLSPSLQEQERQDAEQLFQQAHMVISAEIQRILSSQHTQMVQKVHTLHGIGSALIKAFDMTKLMDILAKKLPLLGISSGRLFVYDSPDPFQDIHGVPLWSRLMLAYHDGERRVIDLQHDRFLTRDLISGSLLPDSRPYAMIVLPLYFLTQQLGIGCFEIGPIDSLTYDSLRDQISSALQGALLVQREQERSEELAQANKEIRHLNEQLKQENVRMSAELDIARRLQEMVLPSPEELQSIEGLEIVGFMKPAEEVGGDYYDVFKQYDNVHIGIGDVTGHGLESGVLMLMIQTAVRTLIDHGETDPVAFLITLNRILYHNIQRMKVDKSLTLVFVNYHNGCLKIVGQHEELLVVRQHGHIERLDTVKLGFPLGLIDDISRWALEATISLDTGEGIVLYTDGITEAESIDGELYGLDRLCDMISRHWEQSAEEIKQAVVDDVTGFIGTQRVFDDLTLVILKQQ